MQTKVLTLIITCSDDENIEEIVKKIILTTCKPDKISIEIGSFDELR